MIRRPVLLAALAALLAVPAAQAQSPVGGNGDQPIDITANALELVDAQRVQVWSGAVEAVQGTNRLRTDTLRVYHGAPASGGPREVGRWGEPERMVAQGVTYFITPESVSKGDGAVYDLKRDVITVTGNVVLTRGESVVRGDTLVIDVASGRSTLDSVAQGRGTNRVRGVFYPDQTQPAAPAARPAAPPR